MTDLETTTPRRGRPPKSDDRATRDRLLDAAAALCIADGFDSVRLADVASRAGVTAAAIYNHFNDRESLLLAAGRRALDNMAAAWRSTDPILDVEALALGWIQPELAGSRRLLLELHLAAARHPHLAELLQSWHAEAAERVAPVVPETQHAPTTVKSFFLLVLGLCHVDELPGIESDPEVLRMQVRAQVRAIFSDPGR